MFNWNGILHTFGNDWKRVTLSFRRKPPVNHTHRAAPSGTLSSRGEELYFGGAVRVTESDTGVSGGITDEGINKLFKMSINELFVYIGTIHDTFKPLAPVNLSGHGLMVSAKDYLAMKTISGVVIGMLKDRLMPGKPVPVEEGVKDWYAIAKASVLCAINKNLL